MLFTEDLLAALECALFVSVEPLSLDQLKDILGIKKEELEPIIQSYKEGLDVPGRGLTLKEVAGGYKLSTKGSFEETVRKVIKPQGGVLSKAALETLAIIAYKQPITRSEVEAIRGVNSDGMFIRLLDRELIYEVGRKDVPGRPILYGTGDDFLISLGLTSLDELPPLNDVSKGEEALEPLLDMDHFLSDAEREEEEI